MARPLHLSCRLLISILVYWQAPSSSESNRVPDRHRRRASGAAAKSDEQLADAGVRRGGRLLRVPRPYVDALIVQELDRFYSARSSCLFLLAFLSQTNFSLRLIKAYSWTLTVGGIKITNPLAGRRMVPVRRHRRSGLPALQALKMGWQARFGQRGARGGVWRAHHRPQWGPVAPWRCHRPW